jgi:vitamin B12 transporter
VSIVFSCLIIVLCAIAPITPIPAAEPPVQMDKIVVTATRTAQIADESLAPVIVINREEIERSQATDVAELLRFHSGLELGRNGGFGQSTSLFTRGTESNHTVVMIDGVKINPGTIGSPALQNINPQLIDRIEIVKGPRSALYGSEAIGGVINIITRQGAPGTQISAGAGGGRYQTRQANASILHNAHYQAGLAVSYFKTDGFPTRVESDIDRGFDNTNLNVYAGKKIGGVDIKISHWQAQGNTEYLDFMFNPLDQDFTNQVSALTLKTALTEQWGSTIRFSRFEDELVQNQSSDFLRTRRYALDWQNDVQISDHQLITAGLWLSQEDTAALSFGTEFDESTRVNAAFIQEDINFADHHILIAARYTDHGAFGTHTTGDLEYGYRLTSKTRITASIGTAFRAPDSTDRFGFGGNPNLNPETSRNIELGLRHAINQHHKLELNIFENKIEDLIDYDFTTSTNVNIDSAQIRGIEANYHYKGKSWGARTGVAIQDPKDTKTDEILPRRARRKLTAALFYDNTRYRFGADLIATSKRKDSSFSNAYNSGYGLINFTASVIVLENWRLRAKIENVFNQDYELADNYNTAGRSLFFQVQYGQ